MSDILRRRLQQTRFRGPHHEMVLSIHLAATHLRAGLQRVFDQAGLTGPQYNVLRILNGAHPDGHSRGEIARRVIDRAPDLTRLIDRLVEQGLAERRRSEEDARRSMTRITPRGRRVLARLAPHVDAQEQALVDRISVREARTLSRILGRIFDEGD